MDLSYTVYVIGAYLSTFASFILITRFILKSMTIDKICLKIAINQSNTIEDREEMLPNRDWRVGAAALVISILEPSCYAI